MRNIFIEELIKATTKKKNIILLVNDLGFGVVDTFRKKFPKNFFNAGIAEQSMIGYAAGLAYSGKHVFVYSINNFVTFRCLEQLRNDVDYHKLPVTIVAVGSGLDYGALGYSHHGLQDYALIRTLPNFLIASPGDIQEVRSCVRYLINNPQPSYLRLSKDSKYKIHKSTPKIYPGKWIKVIDKNIERQAQKNIFLSTGSVIEYAKNHILKKLSKFSLYSLPLWGMKYKKYQYNFLKKYKSVTVIEDHFHDGGASSWLSESITNSNCKTKIFSSSIGSKVVGKVGNYKFLMKYLKKVIK